MGVALSSAGGGAGEPSGGDALRGVRADGVWEEVLYGERRECAVKGEMLLVGGS
mgnify:CR=1 FL=1